MLSKYNAVRHGVLTKVLLPEETNEAQAIQETLIAEYLPKTITEELLIETMAIAYTRRQRAANAEREFMMQVLNPAVFEENVICLPLFENHPVGDTLIGIKEMIQVKPAYKAMISPDDVDVIGKTFDRYITTCERQFYRALHELQRIQALKKGRKPYSIAVDVMSEARGED